MDEFEIQATGHQTEPDRIWTRDKLDAAQWVADRAIRSLAYGKAVVINTYGGVRSDPLYTVEALDVKEGSKEVSCRIESES
jgi:hypothetical protein